jgi:cobalamin-dependent methionine synthase I
MERLPAKLARYLRVAPGSEAFDQAAPVWAEAVALAAPAAWSARLPMADFLNAFAPNAAGSRDLSRTLAGCGEVVLMAATIGAALEGRAQEHFAAGRAFAGYMLDRMGSWLVEARMRALHAGVRTEAKAAGLNATRRYSPGYGDFALDAQAQFIRLMECAPPELTLTQGFILHPRKSVTAVCGLAPDAQG